MNGIRRAGALPVLSVLAALAGCQSQAPAETQLAAVQDHFVPNPNDPTGVVPFSATTTGIAAAARAGDELVLRVTGLSGASGATYVLNGDQPAGTQVPHMDLPPSGNPASLWIAPDGSELVLQLVDQEPPAF